MPVPGSRPYSSLAAFGVRGFSCRIGHAKPEPDAYSWCCRAMAVPASRVSFIDDRPDNVAAAVAAGMGGHVSTSLDALRTALDTPHA